LFLLLPYSRIILCNETQAMSRRWQVEELLIGGSDGTLRATLSLANTLDQK
jgi:hypothetical protein